MNTKFNLTFINTYLGEESYVTSFSSYERAIHSFYIFFLDPSLLEERYYKDVLVVSLGKVPFRQRVIKILNKKLRIEKDFETFITRHTDLNSPEVVEALSNACNWDEFLKGIKSCGGFDNEFFIIKEKDLEYKECIDQCKILLDMNGIGNGLDLLFPFPDFKNKLLK